MNLPDHTPDPSWPKLVFVPQPPKPLEGWIFKASGWGLIVSGVCLAAFGVDAALTALIFN